MDIRTSDGITLAGHLYEPEKPIGAVFIVAAMGVPQKFYEPLATWLKARGFYAMTFDYRGMGASKRGSLAKVDADILTWARRDVAAALDAFADKVGDLPITWLGHSLGGQIIPFTPNYRKATKLITVATGSGYWKENVAPLRRKVWLFWYALIPVLTPMFGYYPGRRAGTVGDLPAGVAWQWRKWCLNPEYAAGAEPDAKAKFAEVTAPLTSFSFTDDEMMSDRNVASIHGFYVNADKAMRRFSPAELGVKRVGHFGFFRREMEAPLWTPHLLREVATVVDH